MHSELLLPEVFKSIVEEGFKRRSAELQQKSNALVSGTGSPVFDRRIPKSSTRASPLENRARKANIVRTMAAKNYFSLLADKEEAQDAKISAAGRNEFGSKCRPLPQSYLKVLVRGLETKPRDPVQQQGPQAPPEKAKVHEAPSRRRPGELWGKFRQEKCAPANK
ncbi:hypothetical protein MPTK1_8g02490 [Marchantia polymorpha subsp. ruderalis]|uniref:Uncharacterized protein n=1 Tax=Marchantia polymorpha TaxID=3197 RepID=A0A2R6XIZ0_MARPO|nr:hypothetical protein MARPO_0012s0046 [Marchantia polymorpha]BBN18438.1 hypothetical protein Mp_8g02490 [Marchantia polymorpha subsp. ruderalis]|eukprot:PTQ46085.1 hypothetical protein MARPO_0012s0046 [Marchantia polymorpha]